MYYLKLANKNPHIKNTKNEKSKPQNKNIIRTKKLK